MVHVRRTHVVLASTAVMVLVLASAVMVLASPSRASEAPQAPKGLHQIVKVGDGTLANAVADRLASAGVSVSSAQGVAAVAAVQAASDQAVIFDGTWFEAHRNEAAVTGLIQRVTSAGGVIVVEGGNTSLLLDTLKAIGLYDFPDGRNPAYTNPPQAAFRTKAEGGSSRPSVMLSNTSDPDALLAGLTRWYEK